MLRDVGLSSVWIQFGERASAGPAGLKYTTGISSLSCSASTLKYKISWP